MGHVSSNAFKRLYALCLIGRFANGAYGGVRVQKTSFFAQEPADVRPFPVHFHYYGQFSHELSDTIEQLLAMSYLWAAPLPSGEGNRYGVRASGSYTLARRVVGDGAPSLLASIDKAVANYGMLPQDELLRRAYDYLDAHKIERGALIFEATLTDVVELPSISDDECDEIELSFTPDFVQSGKALVEALETAPIDLARVPTVDNLSVARA